MSKFFDEKLVKKAYGLISDKYSTESGKKFILHLISSFIPLENKSIDLTLEISKSYKNLECCITKCKIAPVDITVMNEGDHYWGYVSDSSDKILSHEALEALERFIDKRVQMGDDVMTRIHNYMMKKSLPSSHSHKIEETPKKGGQSKNDKPKNKQIKASKASYEDKEALPSK